MPVSLGGADAGGEPEAAQMSPTKHVVGHPAGVGVVLLDGKACLMVQQAVQDVRRLAGRGGDHLGVERTVLVGDMGIERHAGLVTVTRVDVSDSLAAAAGPAALAVRRRGPAVPP